MTHIRVSVLMPVAAPAPFLREALDSVVAQTYENWEIVLVVDGTDAEIRRVANEVIPAERLRLVELATRSGIATALNAGLKVAKGDLIARLDSDDRSLAGRLGRQVAMMDAQPQLALLGTSARLIDQSGADRGSRPVQADRGVCDQLVRRNQFVHSSVMFRRDIVGSLGGYNEECHLREDYELWLRIAVVAEVANLPDALVDYRISPGQISAGTPTRRSLGLVGNAQAQLGRALGVSTSSLWWSRVIWRSSQTSGGRFALAMARSWQRRRNLVREGSARRERRHFLEQSHAHDDLQDHEREATLGDVQTVLLSALKELDRVAGQLGVTYLLVAGSALGAHRHNGFIPWDDDIDVAMTAEDFRRFIELAPQQVRSGFLLHTRAEDPILGASAKMYVGGTRIDGEFGVQHGLVPAQHCGLFLDIFVVTALSDSRIARVWERAWGWVVYVHPWARRMATSPAHVGLTSRMSFLMASLAPHGVAALAKRWLWKRAGRSDSRFLGLGLGGINSRVFERDELLPPVRASFERMPTWVPRDQPAFLTRCFGPDFMVLPPIHERPSHSQRVFVDQSLDLR